MAVVVLLIDDNSASLNTIEAFGEGSRTAENVLGFWSNTYKYSDDGFVLSYQYTSSDQAVRDYRDGLTQFAAIDCPLPEDEDSEGILQIPLLGAGLAIVYNLPFSTSTPLLLSRTVLALIWMGNITMWNDPALLALNPGLELPNAPIILGYETMKYGINNVLFKALSSFHDGFQEVFQKGGGVIEGLPPIINGSAKGFSDTQPKLDFLRSTPFSMSYTVYTSQDIKPLMVARLINKAGRHPLSAQCITEKLAY